MTNTLPDFTQITQTCPAYPTQWNAWDHAGQYYYLRYRSGKGTIEKAADIDDYRNGNGKLVTQFHCDGDPYAGEIPLIDFLSLAQASL